MVLLISRAPKLPAKETHEGPVVEAELLPRLFFF
jgi:hypothetical protein